MRDKLILEKATTEIVASCRLCGKEKTFKVNPENFLLWKDRKMLAQVAFPHLNYPDRELLISGTCGKCWIKLFGKPDEM